MSRGINDAPAFLVSKLRAGEDPPKAERPEVDRRRYLAEGTEYEDVIQH